MSVDASGTIYNTLTASIWKGRNYIRGWFRPSNPKTAGQFTQRTLLATAVAAWQALGAVMPEYYTGEEELYKDQWNIAARDVYPPISGFNYYVMQYCITGAAPTIPAVAPKGTKSIHGGASYGLDVGY
ncbi:hypothetical protein D4R89_12970 [bacterium]|nr:MAG: hypothetical protein D4R89_12970 [bacterium]